MTLILTLAAPWGIHQSSYYRLTEFPTARPRDDDVGAKQLMVSDMGRTAQICFTGIAEVAGHKTRDWIAEIIARRPQPSEIDVIACEIAARWHLTSFEVEDVQNHIGSAI